MEQLKKQLLQHEDAAVIERLVTPKTFGKKETKEQLLLPFMTKDRDLPSYFTSKKHKQLFVSIQALLISTGETAGMRKKQWTVGAIVHNVKLLYLLVKDTRQNGVINDQGSTRSSPKPVFDAFVDDIGDKLQTQKDKEAIAAQRSTRTSLNLQKGTTRRQDLVPFDKSKLDRQTCPACKHQCTMPLSDVATIQAENAAAMNKYNKELTKWTQQQKKSQPKPKVPKAASAMVGCYCFSQQCLTQPDGQGCYNCEDAIKSVPGAAQSLFVPDRNRPGQLKCSCEICSCNCQVIFKQEDRYKIAHQMDLAQASTNPNQPDRDSAGFFRSVLMQNLKGAASENLNVQDAGAMVSTSLLADERLQSNSRLRNNMQLSMGPLTTQTQHGDIEAVRRGHGNGTTGAAAFPSSASAPLDLVASKDARMSRNRLNRLPQQQQPTQAGETIDLVDSDDNRKLPAQEITPTNGGGRKRDAPTESPGSKQAGERSGRMRKSLQEKLAAKSSEIRESTDHAKKQELKNDMKVIGTVKRKCIQGDAVFNQTVRDSIDLGQSTQETLNMMLDEEEAMM